MNVPRWSASFVLCALGLVPGCGPDAAGVDDCRKLENARCEAASHCGDRYRITDVEACKRFYRNQCLHGLKSGKEPGPGQVTLCVTVIQLAGSCAAQHSPTTPLAECDNPTLASETDPALVDVCKVVQNPELTAECSFLTGVAPLVPDGGVGGAGGAGEGGTSATGDGGANATGDGGTNAAGQGGSSGA